MLRRPLFDDSFPLFSLFTVTAAIEVGAGLVICLFPSLFVSLVIGGPLQHPAALTIARIGGAGLVALGIACWIANGDSSSRAARGLIVGMVFYNIAAVALFAYAFLGHGLRGFSLWPSAALHTGMAVWCIAFLRRRAAVKSAGDA
jgi:hypothetical protein